MTQTHDDLAAVPWRHLPLAATRLALACLAMIGCSTSEPAPAPPASSQHDPDGGSRDPASQDRPFGALLKGEGVADAGGLGLSGAPEGHRRMEASRGAREAWSAAMTARVEGHQAALRACFDAALGDAAKPEITLDVRLGVDRSGQLVEATFLEVSQASEAASACARNAMQTWTFPAPEGFDKGTIRLPLVLRRSSENEER